MVRQLPFVRLGRAQWMRLADLAAWMAFACTLLSVGFEAYLFHGVDFRGYYAAARVLLSGGDPYDLGQVTSVLLDISGKIGNSPYYYVPWFCVLMLPFALIPFEVARLSWIALTLGVYWLGAQMTLSAIGWETAGWRRWGDCRSFAGSELLAVDGKTCVSGSVP